MDAVRELWSGLGDISPRLAKAIAIATILIAAVVVERIVVRLLRRAYWRRVDRAAAARGIEELSRMKRQKTLVTLLESLARYGVYGAAVIVALGIATGGRANAVFGASLVVVLVGFGLQRLLGDVVAGALLLFEGHFAVGDVITVHGSEVTGAVEEFSLRTTALRTQGGDRVVIMNGGIASFTRWSFGQREFRVELLARGEGAVDTVNATFELEATSARGLWVRPPLVQTTEPVGEGLVRIVASVVVAPQHEVLVQRLVALLEVQLAEQLVGPVTHLPLYQPAFDAWRTGLLLRD